MDDTPRIPPNGGTITPSGRDEGIPMMDTTFQYAEERSNLAVRGEVLVRNQKSLQHNFAESEEKCDVSFQNLQNESSCKIEDAQWNHQRDTRVNFDLYGLKTTMTSWAEAYSINGMADLQTLVEETGEEAALLEKLSSIVHMEDNGLPACLDTPKAPAILLNALLAHDVYKTIFENPFSFICDKHERNPQGLTTDTKLTGVHKLMLAANEPKAHVWRSDTLRLLRPQNREDRSKAEFVLRSRTDAQIWQMSEWYADEFLRGPARHFVRGDSHVEYIGRTKEIYVTAAEIAYEIWTMRTNLKFLTLEDIEKGGFDLHSSHVELEPERSVFGKQDEGEMFGSQITVLIHPLVLGYETEEKKKKKHGEVVVWAKAVIWVKDKTLRNESLG